MDGETKTKRPLDLDWDQLLPSGDNDEPPPAVIVLPTTSTTSDAAAKQQQQQQKQKQSTTTTMTGVEAQREELQKLSDKEIEESIHRQTNSLRSLGSKLPDKGEKIRVAIKRFEEEKERRRLRRLQQVEHVHEKPTHSNSSDFNGASDGFKQIEAPSYEAPQSLFASQFSKRMEEDTDCRTYNAFDKELSYLGRSDRRKMKQSGQSSPKGRHKSKKMHLQGPSSLSLDSDQHVQLNGYQKIRASSTGFLRLNGESLSSCLAKKRNASQISSSKDARPRKEQTVVLVDEEEPQHIETTHEAEKLPECLKETTIYYPSRDDPESVEISNSDMECLAPDAFLTSTIMNFYIRYLQQPASTTDRERCDYHFFNTYFYEKLKEAVSVSYKGSDKENAFMKFRRWWKGVNIFQKPYVFIPIHEILHWSLVIICIPDKEDESGPIILHLDSLRFHDSRIIFQNIKSFMREEWNHLNQEIAPPDVHIAERIWKQLPRRIEEKSIAVPQQKNDSDCGLFVLYFMKRFIEEAPDRLKKKDLAMFGKQWFKPEEASGLRKKIWSILMEQFVNAQ